MTLRVGASFNPAIEAEGFLACSFCCSRDEGVSCPLLRLTLAGCCLIRMWGGGCERFQDANWGSATPQPQAHFFLFACREDLSVVGPSPLPPRPPPPAPRLLLF